MKMFRNVALVLMAIIMFGGCAGLGKFSPPVQSVVDFVCAPTQTQMDEAAKWLKALDSIQAGVTVVFPAIDIVKASTAMIVLKNGGCFVLAEVQAALDILSSMQAKQVKMMGLKAAPRMSAEQFPALTAAVNGK